jgi:hypothetical protein
VLPANRQPANRSKQAGSQSRNSLFGIGIDKTFSAGSQLLTTSACQRMISSVQKNTREFNPRVFLKFEANLRVSLLLLLPD